MDNYNVEIRDTDLAYDVFNLLHNLGFTWASGDDLNDFEFHSFKGFIANILSYGQSYAVVDSEDYTVCIGTESWDPFECIDAEDFLMQYSKDSKTFCNYIEKQINDLL